MGAMLDIEDHGLGVLERAFLDDDGVVGVEIDDGGTEGETLTVLTTGGNELLHLLLGHDDMTAVVVVVEEQLQACLAVPVATDKTGNLTVAGLDEDIATEGATEVVALLSQQGLLGSILGIGIGQGLGKEQIGYEIFEEPEPTAPALFVLPLQHQLDGLGFEMEHHEPPLGIAYPPRCGFLLCFRHTFLFSVHPRGMTEVDDFH